MSLRRAVSWVAFQSLRCGFVAVKPALWSLSAFYFLHAHRHVQLSIRSRAYPTFARQRRLHRSMKSRMNLNQHHALTQRALELGRNNDPLSVPELADMLQMPSAEIQRLAASALAQLADFGADAPTGAAAREHLHDLDDLATNEGQKDYIRRAAHSAANAIREAIRLEAANAQHHCSRCGNLATLDEHTRSQQAFQRTFCDACFESVYLGRRNFDTKVELNKTITAKAGTLVQSHDERMLADWFSAHHIAYRYDERYRILSGHAVRPDFYLPELDVYVEYWGMDTADYKIGMLKKQQLYQQEGKRLLKGSGY